VALVVACRTPAATRSVPPPPPEAHPAGAPAPISDAECAALVDHAIDVLATTDDLRAELRKNAPRPSCRELSRAAYACAMAATSAGAIAACDSAKP